MCIPKLLYLPSCEEETNCSCGSAMIASLDRFLQLKIGRSGAFLVIFWKLNNLPFNSLKLNWAISFLRGKVLSVYSMYRVVNNIDCIYALTVSSYFTKLICQFALSSN